MIHDIWYFITAEAWRISSNFYSSDSPNGIYEVREGDLILVAGAHGRHLSCHITLLLTAAEGQRWFMDHKLEQFDILPISTCEGNCIRECWLRGCESGGGGARKSVVHVSSQEKLKFFFAVLLF